MLTIYWTSGNYFDSNSSFLFDECILVSTEHKDLSDDKNKFKSKLSSLVYFNRDKKEENEYINEEKEKRRAALYSESDGAHSRLRVFKLLELDENKESEIKLCVISNEPLLNMFKQLKM